MKVIIYSSADTQFVVDPKNEKKFLEQRKGENYDIENDFARYEGDLGEKNGYCVAIQTETPLIV